MSTLDPIRKLIAAKAAEGLDAEQIAAIIPYDTLVKVMAEIQRERDVLRFDKFKLIFPEETNTILTETFHARRLYAKHMEFFKVGAAYRERCAMAANRVGKTFGMGGYETACHLTGLYPKWWEGKRFRGPIRAWACGKTNETTRDIVQNVLLGEVGFEGARKIVDGSGMVPRECLSTKPGDLSWKQGVADLVDTIKVKHISGGWSKLGLKSYQQGRGSFEGVAQHLIWDDEEPPIEVWGEQLMRLATTKGIMMLTFTPLEGMSDVVMQFLPSEMRPAG